MYINIFEEIYNIYLLSFLLSSIIFFHIMYITDCLLTKLRVKDDNRYHQKFNCRFNIISENVTSLNF